MRNPVRSSWESCLMCNWNLYKVVRNQSLHCHQRFALFPELASVVDGNQRTVSHPTSDILHSGNKRWWPSCSDLVADILCECQTLLKPQFRISRWVRSNNYYQNSKSGIVGYSVLRQSTIERLKEEKVISTWTSVVKLHKNTEQSSIVVGDGDIFVSVFICIYLSCPI